jgi:hypothetical protein
MRHWLDSGTITRCELEAGAVAGSLQRGELVVDLRESRPTVSGALVVPPWNARAEVIRQACTCQPARVLLVCLDPAECLAAAALAGELTSEGTSVVGYVRLRGPPPESLPAWLASSPWFGLALLVLVFLGTPLVASLMSLPGRWLRGQARSYVRAAAVAASLALMVMFAWWAGARFTAEAAEWQTVQLLQVRELGFGWLLGLIPAAWITIVYALENALRRRSVLLRAILVVASLSALAMEGILGGFLGASVFDVVAVVVAGCGILAHRRLAVERGRRAARSGATPVLVPQLAASEFSHLGAKARSLALAELDGHRVPEGVVVVLKRSDRLDERWFARKVQGALGASPFVVRSSAPDEDAKAPTPGKYATVLNVDGAGLAEAVRVVLASYAANGVPDDVEVGVLIQPQQAAHWAGVALDEAMRGIVVEIAPRSAALVTAGSHVEKRDRIGAVSRSWVLRRIREIDARALAETMARLSIRTGERAEIEFAVDGSGVVLLQARAAPSLEAPPESDCDRVLRRLEPDLRFVRAATRVLSMGDLVEYGARASTATTEILRDIWTVPYQEANRLLGVFCSPASRCPVVRLEGHLYFVLVSKKPLAAALRGPVLRLTSTLARLRWRRLARRVETAMSRTAMSRPAAKPETARDAARRLLAARQQLLGAPAVHAVATSLLYQLLPAKMRAAVVSDDNEDPLVPDLANNVPDLAFRHPERALPDLSLEQPRLGEGAAIDLRSGMARPPARQAAPRSRQRPAIAARLRSRARVALAPYAAELRRAYLDLGRLANLTEPFEVTLSTIEAFTRGESPEPTTCAPTETIMSAPELSLRDLEAWCGERLPPNVPPAGGATWIGEPLDIPSVSVCLSESGGAGEAGALIVDLPTALLVASLARGTLLIARAGSALCHAALVARQRGMKALFGVGSAVEGLATGDRIRVTRSGEIIPLGPRPAPPQHDRDAC